MDVSSKEVLAFRLDRVKKGPSNWMYAFAVFSLMNGVFLDMGQDITLLAGSIAPYMFESTVFHYVAAIIFGFIGFFSRDKIPQLIYVGLGLYALDMFYAFYIGIASGGIFHAVFLLVVVYLLFREKSLSKELAAMDRPTLAEEPSKDAVI